MEVTKDMLIGEILKKDQTIAAILMASGMHCVGCPASSDWCKYRTDSYESRNALPWMPVFSDGISGRGSYGSWHGLWWAGYKNKWVFGK